MRLEFHDGLALLLYKKYLTYATVRTSSTPGFGNKQEALVATVAYI
jgi:hypothetical protein